MASPILPSHAEPEWALALAIVQRDVAIRFDVTARALVDRILSLPASHGLTGAALASRLGHMALDDLYLATACANGDNEAWRECERKHFQFIRDFARRFLKGAAAEDLAAQVIADLWQRGKIAQFAGRSTLRTWLGAVVSRAALNAAASAREDVPLDDPQFERWHDRAGRFAPSDLVDDGVRLAALVRAAIAGLEDDEKLLILLHYEQGLTLEHMEGVVRVSKATLSRRLQRTRERLRKTIEARAAAEAHTDISALTGAIDRAWAELDLAALLGDPRRLQGSPGEVV